MNWRQAEDYWEQLKGRAKETWGGLTGELGGTVAGKVKEVAGGLRERCHEARDRAGRALEAWSPRALGPREPGAIPILRGLALTGLGAGLMYYLDPDQGRRRRALVRDQLVHLLHEIDDAIGVTARDLGNRLSGLRAGVSALPGRITGEDVADGVVVARVRSALGRVVSHPGSIGVSADRGRVTLSGPILADEVDRLIAAVSAVPGVRGVASRLNVHERAGDISGLQGGTRRTGARPEFLQAHWSPTARLLAGTLGGGLLFCGARRGGLSGLALGVLGTGLLARGLTDAPLPDLLGSAAGRDRAEAGPREPRDRDSGQPGGGKGRVDEVGRTGVYPASGPFPPGEAEVRTPESFVHGQRDDQGREVEGGSEPIRTEDGTVLGGATPPSSSPARGRGPQAKAGQ